MKPYRNIQEAIWDFSDRIERLETAIKSEREKEMNTQDRQRIRYGLLAWEFDRTDFTNVTVPNGPYSETWTHEDGTQIVVTWAPKSDPGTPSI